MTAPKIRVMLADDDPGFLAALGDTVARHGAALEDVVFVATARHRPNVIFQILEPGYVRRRAGGRAEVIRSARVCAAR